MMYLRPGNLFREFVIEDHTQAVTCTGRVVQSHAGSRTLKGCLAEAGQEDRALYSTRDHTVTHTIVQAGYPRAGRSDKLVLGERTFYIVGVDDAGGLGAAVIYYAEEKRRLE